MVLCHLRRFLSNSTIYDRLLLSASLESQMATKCLSSKADSNQNLKSMNKYKPVTHVIFDMDGLLLDTEIIYKKIISEIAESYDKKYTRDIQLKVLGTTEQATASVVIKECGLPLTVNEFLNDFHKRQKTTLCNAGLMEGAERLVKHFYNQKVPIAIATSSGKEAVEIKTKNHKELFNLFHHVVMGSSDPDVKKGKPAPDIFQVCAQRFDDKPSYDKCLVFEDAPNGVTGAVAAGMQTIMVPDPELPIERTSQATVVLKSLMDFKPEEFGLPAF